MIRPRLFSCRRRESAAWAKREDMTFRRCAQAILKCLWVNSNIADLHSCLDLPTARTSFIPTFDPPKNTRSNVCVNCILVYVV